MRKPTENREKNTRKKEKRKNPKGENVRNIRLVTISFLFFGYIFMIHKIPKIKKYKSCLFPYKTYGLELFVYVINKFSEREDYLNYLKDLKKNQGSF